MKASELRVGDEIIGHGVVTKVVHDLNPIFSFVWIGGLRRQALKKDADLRVIR